MELKMEVYSPELELLGILQTFRAVLWAEKAFSAGSFSVESLLTTDALELLRPENILRISDDQDAAGIIEHIQQQAGDDGLYITVKGHILTGILGRRILWGQYNLSGTPSEMMYRLVTECAVSPTRGPDASARVIPGLVLDGAAPAYPGSIRKQSTGGNLLEVLEELGETYQIAFGVRLNARALKMEFWARVGADRSVHQTRNAQIFLSTELDDVLASEYSYDSSQYRNTALVAGEGEGSDRTLVTVSTASASGLALRELFVDARDLQSETSDGETMTPAQYTALLKNRGKEKLAENQLVQSFQVTARVVNPTYVYGEDYFAGDTITVIDERLNVTADAIVYGMERSVTEEGEELSLLLGYGQPTIYDILRKAGR